MEKELIKLLDNAYAPYSNFKVSAIVVTNDNKRFKGVNVENASYGATICAERNAINNAIANGYRKEDFKALHIMNNGDKICYPCFLCLETISELFPRDIDIIMYVKNGPTKTLKVKDFIKYDFSSENLP